MISRANWVYRSGAPCAGAATGRRKRRYRRLIGTGT